MFIEIPMISWYDFKANFIIILLIEKKAQQPEMEKKISQLDTKVSDVEDLENKSSMNKLIMIQKT